MNVGIGAVVYVEKVFFTIHIYALITAIRNDSRQMINTIYLTEPIPLCAPTRQACRWTNIAVITYNDLRRMYEICGFPFASSMCLL